MSISISASGLTLLVFCWLQAASSRWVRRILTSILSLPTCDLLLPRTKELVSDPASRLSIARLHINVCRRRQAPSGAGNQPARLCTFRLCVVCVGAVGCPSVCEGCAIWCLSVCVGCAMYGVSVCVGAEVWLPSVCVGCEVVTFCVRGLCCARCCGVSGVGCAMSRMRSFCVHGVFVWAVLWCLYVCVGCVMGCWGSRLQPTLTATPYCSVSQHYYL